VCVFANLFHSTFNLPILLFLLLLHHFLRILHLLYLLVFVLPVDTSPTTHLHTSCLDFTTFVNKPTLSNRQRTLYPDLIPVCDTSGIKHLQRDILLSKWSKVCQSPDPYMDREGCDPDLDMNERPTLQQLAEGYTSKLISSTLSFV